MNVKILWFHPTVKIKSGFLGHFTVSIEDYGMIVRGVGVRRKKNNELCIYLPSRTQIDKEGKTYHHVIILFDKQEDRTSFLDGVSLQAQEYLRTYEKVQEDHFREKQHVSKETITIVEEEKTIATGDPDVQFAPELPKKRGRPKKVKIE